MTRGKRGTVLLAVLVVGLIAAAVGGYLLAWPDGDGTPESNTTWDFYEITPDGLAIYKTVRGCDEPVRAVARESADRIEVGLNVDFGGICGDIAVDKSADVELRDPLGERPVYDAACLDGERPERDCLKDRREADR